MLGKMQTCPDQLCCFPVCIVSWLASYTHFGEGGRDGGKAGDGVTPFQVLSALLCQGLHYDVQVVDRFLDVTPDMEDGESLQYFQQRSSMMVNIVRRYRQVFLFNNTQSIIFVLKWQQDEARDGERGSVHLCGERLGRWTKGQHGP